MERKTRTRALSWLLSFALMLSLLPGMSLPAYADTTPTVGVEPEGWGTVTITENGAIGSSQQRLTTHIYFKNGLMMN